MVKFVVVSTIAINVKKIIFILLFIQFKLYDACKISEFACQGGKICMPLDKYCDGKDDCGDASDEPKFCTGMK